MMFLLQRLSQNVLSNSHQFRQSCTPGNYPHMPAERHFQPSDFSSTFRLRHKRCFPEVHQSDKPMIKSAVTDFLLLPKPSQYYPLTMKTFPRTVSATVSKSK